MVFSSIAREQYKLILLIVWIFAPLFLVETLRQLHWWVSSRSLSSHFSASIRAFLWIGAKQMVLLNWKQNQQLQVFAGLILSSGRVFAEYPWDSHTLCKPFWWWCMFSVGRGEGKVNLKVNKVLVCVFDLRYFRNLDFSEKGTLYEGLCSACLLCLFGLSVSSPKWALLLLQCSAHQMWWPLVFSSSVWRIFHLPLGRCLQSPPLRVSLCGCTRSGS